MPARLVPHPLLTLAVALVWLMLMNEASPGQFVFGLVLGLALSALTAAWWPARPRVHNLPMMIEYALIVLWDILVSNVVVARIVVFGRNEDLRSCFVTVPLDLRSPEAITVLAGTITMTPGTLSADVAADGRALLIHCLHAPDPDAVRADIKSRYERRLMEIFR